MKKRVHLLAATITLIMGINVTYAADDKQAYAIEGIGVSTCQRFIDASNEKGNLYFAFGGWLDGYYTAKNLHLADTFDMTPWQSTSLLLAIIEDACHQNPKLQFHVVAQSLIQQMPSQRIVKGEKFIIVDKDKGIVFQEEVIRRIKKALTERGVYSGAINSNFDEETKDALRKFQNSANIKNVSGLPDQKTLFELFSPAPSQQ